MNKHKISGNIGLLAVLVLYLSMIVACNNNEDKQESINQDMLTNIELKVEGMTCEGCEKTVTNAVMELTGINHTKVSHIDGNALIEFDKSKTSEEKIKKAIAESGYKVVE